jgi:hypothetical protein
LKQNGKGEQTFSYNGRQWKKYGVKRAEVDYDTGTYIIRHSQTCACFFEDDEDGKEN